MGIDVQPASQSDILLLGAAGQLGCALAAKLQVLGNVVALTREQCDLADAAQVNEQLKALQPQIIVNAAAYTAVDKAQSEPELAARLNAELPALLAAYAAEHRALLVDYSTDYVFDGSKHSPWLESDNPNPLNVYGKTKLDGLRAVENSGCNYLVFRVTWLYSATGNNFPNTILHLAAQRDELAVVCDQLGAPTPVAWLADVSAQCIAQVLADPAKCGLYNLVPAGSVSWYDFAREIVQLAASRGAKLKLEGENIKAVPTSAYPTPARRPANSMLDTAKLKATFAILPPHWRSLFRDAKNWNL
ncbi:MAG: dTDP-4-dehydrorhamnose reductase [Porticoccaceae bacterium]|nr:dTDP-4-dehydrorhamnose reductase [Porticoccaceae bacterium]